MMFDQRRLLYIHGLAGDSRGAKATLLRERYPQILIPDFSGALEERMAQLDLVIGERSGMTLIGSSLGGLMAALFAMRNPMKVKRLVLLAPALAWIDPLDITHMIDVPAQIYHGRQDTVVPMEPTREVARRMFRRVDFIEVDDDHGLIKTAGLIDWQSVLGADVEG